MAFHPGLGVETGLYTPLDSHLAVWIYISGLFLDLTVGIMFSRALGVVALLASLVSSSIAVTYSPVKPPSYPLAVRSPYLSGVLINKVDSGTID
jgi:hypothetical protein